MGNRSGAQGLISTALGSRPKLSQPYSPFADLPYFSPSPSSAGILFAKRNINRAWVQLACVQTHPTLRKIRESPSLIVFRFPRNVGESRWLVVMLMPWRKQFPVLWLVNESQNRFSELPIHKKIVRSMKSPVQTDATLLANNTQHCWMLHVTSICTPCYMLFHVAAQSFKPVKLLAACKQAQQLLTLWANNVASCCVRLHVA